MPEIGSLEILVVAVVAFLVFGPERLPGIARQVGRYASQFRRMVSDVKDEFSMELEDDEARPRRPSRARRPQSRGGELNEGTSKSADTGGDSPAAKGGEGSSQVPQGEPAPGPES